MKMDHKKLQKLLLCSSAVILSASLAGGTHAASYLTGTDRTCPASTNPPPLNDPNYKQFSTKFAEIEMTGDNSGTVQWHEKLGNNTGSYLDCGTEFTEVEWEIKTNQISGSKEVFGDVYSTPSTDTGINAKWTSNVNLQAGNGQGTINTDKSDELMAFLTFELLDGYVFSDFAATVQLKNDESIFGVKTEGRDRNGAAFEASWVSASTTSSGADDFFVIIDPSTVVGSSDAYFEKITIFAISGGIVAICGYSDIGCLDLDGNITAGQNFEVSGVRFVPIPAAAWLFGSALVGLAGVARRRQS